MLAFILVSTLACQSPVATRGTGVKPKATPSSVVSASKQPTTETPVLGASSAPAVLPSDGGSQSQRVTLFGVVRLPAGLVSNNGGGIISNNGGGLIRNNGGSYRLLALEQVPVAGLRVEVMDAAGKPVLDGQGQPIVAVTGARGEFVITTDVPARNLVIRSQLPDNKGVAQALTAKDTRETAVTVDLVSTLTTAYILDRYVATQSDQQRVLDRLPGFVERDTRTIAQQTLVASQVAPPAALDTTSLVETVDRLRQSSRAFDDQMETVRRILLAAGQSGLGEGRLATTVAFEYVTELLEHPDGSVYIGGDRLWRVRPDGILEAVTGGGETLPEKADGLKATALNDELWDFCLDDAGRLIGRFPRGIVRIDADGTARTLVNLSDAYVLAVAAAGGDRLYYIAFDNTPPKAPVLQLFEWTPTQKSVLKGALDNRLIGYRFKLAYHPSVGLLLRSDVGTEVRDDRIDTATAALTPWRASSGQLLAIDHKARQILTDGKGQLGLLLPGASTPRWFDAPTPIDRVGVSFDGASLLVASGGVVYRVGGVGKTVVAGVARDAGLGGQASDLPLVLASALTVDPTGRLYMYDSEYRKMLRVNTDRTVTELPVQFKTVTPKGADLIYKLRIASTGDLFAAWGEESTVTGNLLPVMRRILRIQPDGTQHAFFSLNSNEVLVDWLEEANGTWLAIVAANTGAGRIIRIDPQGEATTVYEGPLPPASPPDWRGRSLIRATGGAYWIYGQGEILRWVPGSQPVRVTAGAYFHAAGDEGDNYDRDSCVASPDGWLYFAGYTADGTCLDRILGVDPTSGALRIVAGEGGGIFNGKGVDNSLKFPYNPVFEPDGSLLFIDSGHRQVKRIPKDALQGKPVPPGTPLVAETDEE